MGHASVTINGRNYRLACSDGEEARLNAIGQHVSMTVDKLVKEFGQIGTDRLLVMAAIMITDELFETLGMPADGGTLPPRDSDSETPSDGEADAEPDAEAEADADAEQAGKERGAA
jgi:cell division protein ZapA (FtsZ GTPase activity inhibitor)